MQELIDKLKELGSKLNIEDKRIQIAELKKALEDENLWKDWEKGQRVAQDLSALEKEIQDYELLELLLTEGSTDEFEKEFKKLEIKTFLGETHDKFNAVVSIHAGQGGTEAMDWTEMLYRMYKRYAERKNR